MPCRDEFRDRRFIGDFFGLVTPGRPEGQYLDTCVSYEHRVLHC